MKTSAIKILQSYLNKKSVNNLKKKINTINLAIVSIVIIISLILWYLLKPFFFVLQINQRNNYWQIEGDLISLIQ